MSLRVANSAWTASSNVSVTSVWLWLSIVRSCGAVVGGGSELVLIASSSSEWGSSWWVAPWRALISGCLRKVPAMSISVASGTGICDVVVSPEGGSVPRVGGDPAEAVGMYGVGVVSETWLAGGEAEYTGPTHARGGPPVACSEWMYSVAAMAWCTKRAGPVAGCGQRQPVVLRTGGCRTWKGWPSAGTSGVAVVLGMMGHVGMGETDWYPGGRPWEL